MSPLGHIRTPHYLRGKTGVVERILGPFNNPEQLAYMVPALARTLYRVRFEMGHIWPDAETSTNPVFGSGISQAPYMFHPQASIEPSALIPKLTADPAEKAV